MPKESQWRGKGEAISKQGRAQGSYCWLTIALTCHMFCNMNQLQEKVTKCFNSIKVSFHLNWAQVKFDPKLFNVVEKRLDNVLSQLILFCPIEKKYVKMKIAWLTKKGGLKFGYFSYLIIRKMAEIISAQRGCQMDLESRKQEWIEERNF